MEISWEKNAKEHFDQLIAKVTVFMSDIAKKKY